MFNTNWNLYKSFIVAYETRNLHRAAQILKITRPAVSRNIRELSTQLGVTLFQPTVKGVEPTAEADELYAGVKPMADKMVSAEETVQKFTPASFATIKMAVANILIELYIADFLKIFLNQYPNVQIEFFDRDRKELLTMRKIDFAIDLDYTFESMNVKTMPLVVLNDTLAATKEFLSSRALGVNMTKEQFAKLPLVASQKPFDETKKLWTTNQYVIKTMIVNNTYAITKNSLAVGYFVREYLDHIADPNLCEITVEDLSLPKCNIVCAYNNLSAPASTFLSALVNFCAAKTWR
jgi:DNA-binding transcriptional LysR family regulator